MAKPHKAKKKKSVVKRQAIPVKVGEIITLSAGVPKTEFSFQFSQRMADAMSLSFFKYGSVPDAYPRKVDAIGSLETRLDLYKNGGVVKGVKVPKGNPGFLIDLANFAMIEYMHPRILLSDVFVDTDATSPGRTHEFTVADAEAKNSGASQAAAAGVPTSPHGATQSDAVYPRRGD